MDLTSHSQKPATTSFVFCKRAVDHRAVLTREMHALGKVGWLESAEYAFRHDAGGDEGLVILAHGLHHLWIGWHTVFTVVGRFKQKP